MNATMLRAGFDQFHLIYKYCSWSGDMSNASSLYWSWYRSVSGCGSVSGSGSRSRAGSWSRSWSRSRTGSIYR